MRAEVTLSILFGLIAAGIYLFSPASGLADESTLSEKTGDNRMTSTTAERVVLAGGCFWGMEELLRKIPGVIQTRVGYAGGGSANPRYEEVKTGATGHAESVEILYDPKVLSFADLLAEFFLMHDPTTVNRQGNDVGSQYRSAIFYTTEAQREVAEAAKARVQRSGQWSKPVVTEVVAAGDFTLAEDYHQDYLQKHPSGYTCHFMREAVPGYSDAFSELLGK